MLYRVVTTVLLRTVLIVALLLVTLMGSSPLSAHGVVDQTNITSCPSIFAHAGPSSNGLVQEFTPSQTSLVAFDLEFQSSDVANVTIHRLDPSTPVLSSIGPIAIPSAGIHHFELPVPLALTPGTVYVIFLRGNTPLWCGAANSYPGGNGYSWIAGNKVNIGPGQDLGFQTYSQEAVTAIELVSFGASTSGDTVSLDWVTGTERNNAGFNLYRADVARSSWTQVNSSLIAAHGSEVSGGSYAYSDRPAAGTYQYILEDVDTDGTITRHEPVTVTVGDGILYTQKLYLPTVTH